MLDRVPKNGNGMKPDGSPKASGLVDESDNPFNEPEGETIEQVPFRRSPLVKSKSNQPYLSRPVTKRSLRHMAANLLLSLCYVSRNLGTVSDRLPEEHTLILTQVKLSKKLRLVAVVEPSRQTHGRSE